MSNSSLFLMRGRMIFFAAARQTAGVTMCGGDYAIRRIAGKARFSLRAWKKIAPKKITASHRLPDESALRPARIPL
jgi:hypothetical protein